MHRPMVRESAKRRILQEKNQPRRLDAIPHLALMSSLPCGRCWSGNNHWTHARWLTPVASSVWKCCPRHFQGQALPSRLDKAATEARLVRARALVLALALVRSDVASSCTIAVPSLRQLRCNCRALAFVTTKQLFDSALYLRAPRSVCGYPVALVVPQKPAWAVSWPRRHAV